MRFGTSYFGNRMLKHARKDLEELKSQGFEIILHTYSENDFQFYRKTMKDLIEMSKDMGFEVWIDPWGWGGIFGGEAYSGFLQMNMEEAQLSNRGKRKGSVCFNSEKFRHLMKEWIDAVKEAGADVVFWDEPHFHEYQSTTFPHEWTCRCERCQTIFNERYNYDIPVEYNDDVSEFRSTSILDFFKDLTSYASEKGLRNSLCFLPEESDQLGIKNYRMFVELEAIDDIGSDPYWIVFNKPLESFVKEVTNRVVKLAKEYGKTDHMWIQAFRIPKGRENEILKAWKTMEECGVSTILFWGIDACSHMSSIASEDPGKVWKIVLDIVNGRVK